LSRPARADLAEATAYCGIHSGRDVDKFKQMNSTPLQASVIAAPLGKEAVCNLECRLVDQLDTGDHTIFVGQIIAAHLNDNPQKLLCLVPETAGFELILKERGYIFGIPK